MSGGLHAQLRGVSLSGQPVLQAMAFDIRPACWTAIVGPNGAGKSTLLRTLAGVLDGDGVARGEVTWGSTALSSLSSRQRARTLAWLGQGEAGGADLRAQDVVMLGRLPHQAWLAASTETDHLAVREAMQRTDCWDWRCRPMGQLSGGERQRVLLARALAVQAPILLMDEPLSHLDPPHQADWLDVVRDQVARGTTVVSVLHELNVALLADDLMVLDQGQLVHTGATDTTAARDALVRVFKDRIRLVAVDGKWVALPKMVAKVST